MKKIYFFLLIFLSISFCYAQSPSLVRGNLYIDDGKSGVLVDGNLTQYDSTFSNDIDGLDARKMLNFSENFGLLRDKNRLVIERRTTMGVISPTDSIFFWMNNLLRTRKYFVQVLMDNIHVSSAVFQDLYLHKDTSLNINDTTDIPFTINADPASYDSLRFRIVFGVKPAPPKGSNTKFNVFPNPVRSGGLITLQFDSSYGPAKVTLYSATTGEKLLTDHIVAESTVNIDLPNIPRGIYVVVVRTSGNIVMKRKILVL